MVIIDRMNMFLNAKALEFMENFVRSYKGESVRTYLRFPLSQQEPATSVSNSAARSSSCTTARTTVALIY
jgi:hypothetical protein